MDVQSQDLGRVCAGAHTKRLAVCPPNPLFCKEVSDSRLV